ncbi:MAG TPA: 4Fe-4S dicluster domain-containing protein [Rhizomicrobium sp.]|jgi:molybdopterin-containing oxidoreductase family iron-sulfur binding subunit
MPSLKTPSELDRRVALKLLASVMAATMARCSRPDEEIIPYANMPEGLVAGEPMRFATTLMLAGYGRGFLGISVDGRPIKIEGNPKHPFSLGATDIFAEAEVLSLYDPDRSTAIHHGDAIATWDEFAADWGRAAQTKSGEGFALVSGRIVSPTTLARIAALKSRVPELRWYRTEPVNDDAARAGSRLAFGRVVTTLPRWANADVILSLDADSLGHGPDELRIARAYASRRGNGAKRQRIHVAEPVWTLTGAAADFRIALRPEIIREIARAVANAYGANLGTPQLPDYAKDFAQRAGNELMAARGKALVLAGESQPAQVHALCHWINAQLGAPVDYLPSQDTVENDHAFELAALAEDLHARRIKALIVADANPVYDAPDALRIADGIASLPFSAHIGLYRDETARACHWHLPLSHALEIWGDARALDGTASIVQPLIQKLYPTRTRDEYLAWLANEAVTNAYDLTCMSWQNGIAGKFDAEWRKALNDGVVANSAAMPLSVAVARVPDLPRTPATRTMTIALSPDPSVWDGRYANNAWLQECSKPFTKQVWGNAVQIAPGDAQRFNINDEDTVDIEVDGKTVTAPAILTPGQADGVIGMTWGQGRLNAGRIGTGIGTRVCAISSHPFARALDGATIRKSAHTVPFRSTQAHTRLQGRTEDLFQIATLAELAHPEHPPKQLPPSLLSVPAKGEYAWAMVVDTDACIGCNACVVACQSENNVPVVGPEEISRGRDMHWLRVDSYIRPHGYTERRGFQPVPCMHCEFAPCEPVCPVEASVHDREGLNVQVYNRCIGTRFCEANCPYKVRRFNWFDYSGDQAYADEGEALKAQHNPDVSARGRGVMEKCNYCLQRISRARKTAEKEDRKIAEGEMVTACQAACPTRAIHFGDLNRADSDVSKLRHAPQHYTLLQELNTRPRTTYLRRIFNSDENG